jgi:hypothetical protein
MNVSIPENSAAIFPRDPSGPGVWAYRWSIALAVGSTLALELALWQLGSHYARPAGALLGLLAGMTLWLALAVGILAADPDNWLAGAVRGGILTDTAGGTLLVIALFSPSISLWGAVKVYLLWEMMAILSLVLVRGFRSRERRYQAAVWLAGLWCGILSSPFWSGGLLRSVGGEARWKWSYTLMAINPFYAITAAVRDTTGIVWQERSVLYGLTAIGQYGPAPSVPWYVTFVGLAGVSLALLGIRTLVARKCAAAD